REPPAKVPGFESERFTKPDLEVEVVYLAYAMQARLKEAIYRYATSAGTAGGGRMTTATETGRPRAFDPSMAAGRPAPSEPPGWDLGTEQRIDNGEMLARSIAWMAMGLGAAELIAPRTLARALGLDDHAELIRMYGV